MGISIDEFCKKYKTYSNAKDKTFEEFIKKHITVEYINYIEKCVNCDGIVNSTCYIKDGDRLIAKINSPNRYLFFVMRLIELYTDIEFASDNIAEDFDKLNKIGAINVLINAIPENESTEFSTILNMKMDDFRDNEYSTTALFYNLKNSFSLSEEVIKSVIEELTKENE